MKTSFPVNFCTILLLASLVYSSTGQSFSTIRSNHDSYGSRLTVNDNVIGLARNDLYRYEFHFGKFGPDNYCSSRYVYLDSFVMNFVVAQKQNEDLFTFVYLRTDEESDVLELGLININRTACLTADDTFDATEIEVHKFFQQIQEVSILRVDRTGDYAYGFISRFAYILDIVRRRVATIELTALLPNVSELYPKDAQITRTKQGLSLLLLVGYFRVSFDATLPAVYLFRLQPPNRMILVSNLTLVYDIPLSRTFSFGYSFDYVISISIEHTTEQALIALPYCGRTFLLQFNSTNLRIIRIFQRTARSVSWLNNGTRAAMVLSDVATLPWSSSQIQIINTTSNETSKQTLYAIPNNQQTIQFLSPRQSVHFLRVVTSDQQPIILTSDGFLIYVPTAPAGQFIELIEISSHLPEAHDCPSGTFKRVAGPHPCSICPAGYRRNGSYTNQSESECFPCSPKAFCPPGAIGEVNLSDYSPISQAYPYPNPPPSSSFEDILLTNAFQVYNINRHCLLVSPLFWMLIMVLIIFCTLCIMITLYCVPNHRNHFKLLARIFRHTDFIGEGQMWIGGLFSFALIVLIVFAFWFGTVFHQQYPIETSTESNFACDKTLRNAKFVSSLQLLELLKTDEEKPVFDLLNQQNWTLTLSFIQTAFQCSQINLQGSLDSYRINIPIDQCFLQPDNATRTIIIPLTSHSVDLQLNLTGNGYIGGLRICLSGAAATLTTSPTSVNELRFCQLLSTPDQTLSQTMTIDIDFTKVINRTEGLGINDPVRYSGIWIPTVTWKSLSDRIAYSQRGDFLRYLSWQQVVLIHISETAVFIKNSQEPIARSAEILFKNILFSSMCLELFGLGFLLIKLVFVPMTVSGLKKIKLKWDGSAKKSTVF